MTNSNVHSVKEDVKAHAERIRKLEIIAEKTSGGAGSIEDQLRTLEAGLQRLRMESENTRGGVESNRKNLQLMSEEIREQEKAITALDEDRKAGNLKTAEGRKDIDATKVNLEV